MAAVYELMAAEYGLRMREHIMKMAAEKKGFVPPLPETVTTDAAATAAETNYRLADALRAFNQISGDSGVLEFQSILGKLPLLELVCLECIFEADAHLYGNDMSVRPRNFIIISECTFGGDKVYGESGADFVPNSFYTGFQLMRRENIMKMAGKVKGFVPPLFETVTTEAAAMAADTNYSMEDAVQAFRRIPGGGNDSGVIEFQNIVGKLPSDDLRTLEKLLEKEYHRMLRSEMGVVNRYSYWYPMRHPEVDVSGDFVPGSFHAEAMRKNIMKMAGKVKGFIPTLLNTVITEAAANYSMEDAVQALRRIPGRGSDSGVIEFQNIVGKLPADDLRTLEKLLEEPYHTMLRSEMGVDHYLLPEVKPASGGGDSFATKFGVQAIGAMFTKVAGGLMLGVFETPTTLEPFEKVAGAVGLMSVIGGLMLQGKKLGLSKAMVKIGSVAIALAMIVPMAGNLENVIMSWIFGLLATVIVMVTITFA